jgi:hypothetical protein
MCFQDWRIGRLIRSKYYTDADGVGILLPPNQCRVGITFCMAEYGSDPLTDDNFLNIYIDNTTPQNFVLVDTVLHMTIATHGDLPTHGWFAQDQSEAGGASIVEYTVPESMLTLGLELLQREYPGFPRWSIGQ